MKYILYSIICLFVFSGCANNNLPIETDDKIYTDKDGILNINIVKNENLYIEDEKNKKYNKIQTFYRMKVDLLKKSLYMAAKETLKNNKENFVIVNPDMNHLLGFPINNFDDLKNYCYNFNRAENDIKLYCRSLDGEHELGLRGNLKIIPITSDYKIVSINAKKILEEISKEPK